MTAKQVLLTASVDVSGDKPPTEFRLFMKDVNTFEGKGIGIFDEQAAIEVMAAYTAHGVDIMIDLEHLSLDPYAPAFDPDARGWCKLEVRGGELWAVDVKWTEDGARRLNEKTQRYVSPVFFVEYESRRIVDVTCIALCAMPATYQTPALIAASIAHGALGTPVKPEPNAIKDFFALVTANRYLAENTLLASAFAGPSARAARAVVVAHLESCGHDVDSVMRICAHLERGKSPQ